MPHEKRFILTRERFVWDLISPRAIFGAAVVREPFRIHSYDVPICSSHIDRSPSVHAVTRSAVKSVGRTTPNIDRGANHHLRFPLVPMIYKRTARVH